MPATEVSFYRGASGRAPVVDWLQRMRRRDEKGFVKCAALLRRLAEEGHELRRPHADAVRGGIRELRVRYGRVQHRILYFFHGRHCAVLVHGLTKEARIPPGEVERALARKRAYEADPAGCAYEGTVD